MILKRLENANVNTAFSCFFYSVMYIINHPFTVKVHTVTVILCVKSHVDTVLHAS